MASPSSSLRPVREGSPVFHCAEYVQYIEPVILEDGSRMEGDFDHGTGIGSRIFKDGHIWKGKFVNWWLNGEGEHIFPDGTIWRGIFQESRLNGIALMISPDGKTQEALFKNGTITHKLLPVTSDDHSIS